MAERALKSVPHPAERDEAPERRETQPAAAARPVDASGNARKFDRKRLTRWALFGLLPVALIVGGYFYFTGGKIMSTDDAYIDADKVGISTDVAGLVQDVDVTDNQHVTTGQILYRLDPRQFQIALDNAKANLAQTALTIESTISPVCARLALALSSAI